MHFSSLAFLSSALLATPILCTPTTPIVAKSTIIYQFPNPTWIENIFATSNGSLLVSLALRPELHILHPSTNTGSLVHQFPNVDSLFGITEVTPNVFAVIAGNYSLATGPTPGSSSVWTVDLTGCGKSGQKPKVRKIADVKEGQLLNGAATLNPSTVLLADSFAGTVIALNIHTGKHETVLNDTSLQNAVGQFPIGVNGLKTLNGYLYYTNLIQETFSRVAISPVTGRAIGPFEKIADGVMGDDFAIQKDGTAFVALPVQNEVVKVSKNGVVEKVLGSLNDTVVAGVTCATLGRGNMNGRVFFGTNGALSGPVNGTFTEGGKVVGIWV